MNTRMFAALVLVLLLALPAVAQVSPAERKALRSYTSPDELVSIAPSTPMDKAVAAISDVSRRFVNKIVVDTERRTMPVNIDIQAMHWRDALDAICRKNGFWYTEFDTYIQLNGDQATGDAAAGKARPEGIAKEFATFRSREIKISAVFFEVNLTRLATQFIEYIDTMRMLDLEIAGEFLVMAATLMYIKSRELLPVDQQAQVEGEDEGEDPRWELIRQLVEYKKFKDAASQLQVLEARQEDVFPRTPGKLEFEPESSARPEASIFDLVNAVNVVLKRLGQREDQRDIFEDKWTVSEKIELLMRVLSERPSVRFSELFEGVTSRSEVVVTFLALLELIRLRQLAAVQREPFGEIEVCRAAAAPSPAAPATGTDMNLQPAEPPAP